MTDEFSDQERYAILQRAQAVLDSTAGIKEQLRERQARAARGERDCVAPVRPDPKPEPRKHPERRAVGGDDWWLQTQRWVEQIIDQRVGAATLKWVQAGFADNADATLDHLQERFTRGRQMTNDRVKEAEDAATQLIAGLEARIAELEKRAVLKPVRPQLVSDGGPDAAG